MKLSDAIPIQDVIASVDYEESQLREIITDSQLNHHELLQKFPHLREASAALLDTLDALCSYLFIFSSSFYIGGKTIEEMTSMAHEIIDHCNDIGNAVYKFNNQLTTLKDIFK